ncbi:hypothetical protein quinque_002002 [Culex quinquefasciatus]
MDVVASLGARVNVGSTRMGKIHVIFGYRLIRVTYQKAKNLNIPLLSILEIETCKRHLCIIKPANFPILNQKRFRQSKTIQPPVLHQIRILNEFQNDNAMTQEPQDRKKYRNSQVTSSGVSSEPPMEEIDRENEVKILQIGRKGYSG